MKVIHWGYRNGSGLHRVSQDLADAEVKLGIDSVMLSTLEAPDVEKGKGVGADIHVSHSHVPDEVRTKDSKIVWVGHGTPEHCFQVSVEQNIHKGYGAGDAWMLLQYWVQHANAVVTFWPRHQKIYQSLSDRNTIVDCIPLGVDKEFWKQEVTKGKYAGTPSVFTCENAHYIKWPLDLFLMWPWIVDEIPLARVHCIYLPTDQHRFWFPLVNRNGVSFRGFLAGTIFGKDDLKNAFNSVDYVTSFVRYGDFNRVCLEAKACGAKIISWTNNLYADFWIPEGDQRIQAKELIEILKGNIQPRQTNEIPDIVDTARAMIKIYERILT